VTDRSFRFFMTLTVVAGLLAACTSQAGSPSTVTRQVTVAPSSPTGKAAAGHESSAATAPTGQPGAATGQLTRPPITTPAASTSGSHAPVAGEQPDGFVPTKLKPGQKAPQFIVVSFDGVGWHEKWQYFNSISAKVQFHFTGFLTGLYLLSEKTKDKYQGPGHGVGKSSVGWTAPADVPVQVADLNQAYRSGNEIGSHFNGHFCAGDGPSGNDWSTGQWNNELDQFMNLITNVRSNNALPGPGLVFGPSEVIGERTPCLEGTPEQLYPALQAHHMTYDSSFTRRGISWPTQSKQYKIWQMGMAEFPVHDTSHFQVTMDYNFYYTQRGATSKGVTASQSAVDSAQVQATYQDMYDATTAGNRAPLILGNHFNDWNNNAYTTALGGFLLANCGKPDTYCVPFRDVVAWMKLQDPAVLASLQNQAPELGPRSN
jgi:hypothetical protein